MTGQIAGAAAPTVDVLGGVVGTGTQCLAALVEATVTPVMEGLKDTDKEEALSLLLI